jgi:hypothetical protein
MIRDGIEKAERRSPTAAEAAGMLVTAAWVPTGNRPFGQEEEFFAASVQSLRQIRVREVADVLLLRS